MIHCLTHSSSLCTEDVLLCHCMTSPPDGYSSLLDIQANRSNLSRSATDSTTNRSCVRYTCRWLSSVTPAPPPSAFMRAICPDSPLLDILHRYAGVLPARIHHSLDSSVSMQGSVRTHCSTFTTVLLSVAATLKTPANRLDGTILLHEQRTVRHISLTLTLWISSCSSSLLKHCFSDSLCPISACSQAPLLAFFTRLPFCLAATTLHVVRSTLP